MAEIVEAGAIPGGSKTKVVKTQKIELKNVLSNEASSDITVEVVPFDRYNDDHVEFAFNYQDMLLKVPSPFMTVSDASRGYVDTFMVHNSDDAKNENSDYRKVRGDLRAARTLMHQEGFMNAVHDFFTNA